MEIYKNTKLSNISTSIFQVQNLINLLEQLSSYFWLCNSKQQICLFSTPQNTDFHALLEDFRVSEILGGNESERKLFFPLRNDAAVV